MFEKEEQNPDAYKKNAKIFIVDDSEISRNSMTEILENAGFNVVGSAPDANTCLANITAEANLFILDVVMPETSGIELCQVLHENLKNIMIIMVSSLSHEHILIESIANGAKDFLKKPFDADELITSVSKAAKLMGKEK